MAAAEPIGVHERNRLLQGLMPPLAIAVSGGPDSMALMHLVAGWIKARSRTSSGVEGCDPVIVVTVDHGLRPGSADEAEWVAGEARRLGLPHLTLKWRGPKPTSAIQEAARKARLGLLMAFAGSSEDLPRPREILLAHHLDDQAETLLMRLARGSGVDGLSAMRAAEERTWLKLGHPVVERPITFRRPLLAVPKQRLVATLDVAGIPYLRDPSNEQARFERVRLRAAAPYLEPLGLANEHVATAAERLGRARLALEEGQYNLARAAVHLHHDAFASIDAETLRAAPEELQLRVLQSLIQVFGGRDEPPRRLQIEALVERLKTSGLAASTLAGVVVGPAPATGPSRQGEREALIVYREPGRRGLAARRLDPGHGIYWDRRFYVSLSAAAEQSVEVRVLGGDFSRLKRRYPALAALKMPPRAAATLPAIVADGRLIAVPSLSAVAAELRGPMIASEYALEVGFAAQHTRAVWGEAMPHPAM